MKELAKKLEGYETPQWAIDRILDVELMTGDVLDPCCGFGVLGQAALNLGYGVRFMDIYPWADIPNMVVKDFLTHFEDLSEETVFMNPPFSKACQFVDHARAMNARKIICFQRYSWREGALDGISKRGAWWEKTPPARTWVCGDRAQCLRFDIRSGFDQDGKKIAPPPTVHAWFVWKRGHRGAEITRGLYK